MPHERLLEPIEGLRYWHGACSKGILRAWLIWLNSATAHAQLFGSYQAAVMQSLSLGYAKVESTWQNDMISRAWADKGARGSICLHAPFVKAMPLDCGTC